MRAGAALAPDEVVEARARGRDRLVLGRLGDCAVGDLGDDRRVGERRRVAERSVFRDVTKQAPHDLARPRLRAAPA